MVHFPDTPFNQGINAPSRIEVDLADLEVDGEIPTGMDGAFYRVAPDRQYPSFVDNDVPFNADGAVSCFRFHNGRVDMKHRYVRTDRFNLERAAGRALFGAYRNPFTDDPSVKGKNRNLANTNVLVHAGRLLALREDSPPVAMDPVTLETRGNWTFGGKLTGETFSAHAKIDPETGGMVSFGYGAKGLYSLDTAYYEIDAAGDIVHTAWIKVPYYSMLHDWGVSRDYVVFPIIPSCGVGEELLKQGKPYYAWDSTKPIYLGVMRRFGDGKDIRWFKAPNQFCSHVMNCFNDGTKVHIDVPRAESNMFPFFPELGKPWDPAKAASRLTRWTVDMASNSDEFTSAEQLTDFIGEFPRNDDRYQTVPYRHGWLLGFDFKRASVAHVDVAKKQTDVWYAPGDVSLQEPCFVPKFARAAEGEGWLLQAATDAKEMRTYLYLFEALRIADGPIATVKLPLRLKPGYHGSWATAAQIAGHA